MAVFIQSRHDGFRRCGEVHTRAGRSFPEGHFTDEQLEQLNADPEITMVAGTVGELELEVPDEQPDDDAAAMPGVSDETIQSKEIENENTDTDDAGGQPGDGTDLGGDEAQTEDLDGAGSDETGQVVAEDLLQAARKVVAAGDTIKSGAPDITAMENILGRDVSAAERDLAWDAIQAEGGGA